MVTINEIKNSKLKVDGDYIFCELSGKSTDEKPIEMDDKKIDNGSTYIEIDTGKLYLFDLDTKTWKEI